MRRLARALVACMALSMWPAWGASGPPYTPPAVSGVPAPGAAAYVGPCDILGQAGTPCVAAHGVTRRLFGAYTGPLFQVKRQSDSTTQDISSLPSGLYNAAAVASFCAGTSCGISQIYDQSGNGNVLPVVSATFAANSTPGYMAPWSIHYKNGLPVVWTSGNKAAYRNRTATANIPTGTASSSTYGVLATDTYSNCCGGYGRMEAFVASNCPTQSTCPNGTMWAIGYTNYGRMTTATAVNALGLGVDHEFFVSAFRQANVPLVSSIVTKYNQASGQMTNKYGDATATPLRTIYAGAPPITPAVQAGISLGEGGDASAVGMEFFEGAVTAGATTDATDAALQANVAAFYGSQVAPMTPPVDAMVQNGFTTGGSNLDISSIVTGAWGLRRLSLSYTGNAALIVRASDSATLDVGFTASGDFDDPTAQAFCAGTTCYAKTVHSQALRVSSNTTAASTQDMNIQSSGQAITALPQILFNGLNGRTVLHFSGGQYLCTSGSFAGLSTVWSSMAVARRSGNTTTLSNVLDTLNESQGDLQFAATANTAQIAFYNSGGGTVTGTAADNAFHSLIAVNANGTANLTVDGGTTTTGTFTTANFTGYACLGGDLTKHPLTGDIGEAYVSEVAMTPAQIATIYANQRAYYGNQF